MKVTKKIAKTNLKLNKKRTIITIVGIILSVALITALSTLISSFKESLYRFYIQERGYFHYVFYDVDDDNLENIKKNKKIESYSAIEDLGYAKINSKNEFKPYVHIIGMDKNDYNTLAIKLLSGRMPENDNEILISKHLKTNEEINYKIGDEIEFDIGKRVSDGYTLNLNNPYDKNEILDIKTHKKYKVVGIIDRPIYALEPFSNPGYTVITNKNGDYYSNDVYVRYTQAGLKYRYRVTASIIGVSEKMYEDSKGGIKFNSDLEYDRIKSEMSKAKFKVGENSNLIYIETMPINDYTVRMLYTTFVVVALIIMTTSVFCIKNSFDIQVTEKMGLFGMLKSVGATKKQIKKNVLYEGFILGVIGIPLGIIFGLLASYILIIVCNHFLDSSLALKLRYSISILAIVVSIILSIITIYLSAIKSAKKASKVEPIRIIRNGADIKIKKSIVKTPKIIKKIFGVGGVISYKNIKRNRKKYRTIIISIIVCVSVFIATSTFMDYSIKMTSLEFPNQDYNIYLNIKSNDNSLIKNIVKLDTIEKYSIRRTIAKEVTGFKLTDEMRTSMYDRIGQGDSTYAVITSYGDVIYKEYLNKLKISYEDAKDKVILINKTMVQDKETYINKEIITTTNDVKDKVSIKLDDEIINTEIIKITDIKPQFSKDVYGMLDLIVSDTFMDKLSNDSNTNLYIYSNNPDSTEEEIKKVLVDENYTLNNYSREKRQIESLYTLIAIFLYGFITVIALIGVTNIFNTITTSMELRSKEFAMLKSIGMTKKEFNKMIMLESMMNGVKALIFALPIGIMLSYLIYISINSGINKVMFVLPIKGMVISVASVFILMLVIMKYSLDKINKQNIIETIRKDNI